MRGNKSLRDFPIAVLWNSYGLSSLERLVQNSTDASSIAILNDTTDGIHFAKFQDTKNTKEEQRQRK